MPARKTGKTSKPAVRKPAKRKASQGKAAATLPKSMITGKASPAKAVVGDKAVFAHIARLPQPQRSIAESVDALAATTLPACSAPSSGACRTTAPVAAVPGVGKKKR